jgi:hypothetical protein
VFQGCFVVQNLFAFHASILVRFPGRYQRISRETPVSFPALTRAC